MSDDTKATERTEDDEAEREAERQRILEQARREIPALREQTKQGIARLRRIAKGDYGR
jgi:hypothetical protein